ncbi:MAG TPA: glycosyltransferase N-terminal domain-containing protein [Spirochaetota bacterium]|nr:glycosyltransferase N-terminal domain-containing protein [Spirochaetota bacterium]
MFSALVLSIIIKPLFYAVYGFLFLTGRITFRELAEKAGFIKTVKQKARHIWVHVAALGEYHNSYNLIKKIKNKYKCSLVLTCFHQDVYRLAAEDKSFTTVYYLPFENYYAYRRLIDNYNIDKLFIFETELWPLMLLTARLRRVAVYLLNAYIYDKDYRRYRLFAFLFKKPLGSIKKICVQTGSDKNKFRTLGAASGCIKVCGDLKYDIALPAVKNVNSLKKKYKLPLQKKIVTAASLHKGEEKILINQIKKRQQDFKNVYFILAPRYINLTNTIEKQLQQQGWLYNKRSWLDQGKFNKKAAFFILDSVGELKSFFPCSDLVFMGGSLIPHGGHNILEPLFYNCKTFSGKHIFHFTGMFKRFTAYVDTVEASALADYILACLKQRPGENGRKLLKQLKGAQQCIWRELSKE